MERASVIPATFPERVLRNGEPCLATDRINQVVLREIVYARGSKSLDGRFCAARELGWIRGPHRRD
jgi:hypothetical protein